MRIIIAGGGTGGHLFPGIAIAEAFMEKDKKNEVIFVGTGKPFETSILSKTCFMYQSITAEGIKGLGLWNQIVSIVKIPKGVFDSIKIIKNFKPDLVLGVGGYSAGPVGLGAWLLGIKIVIHEQNILPGITNRILSHFADRIYVSFKNTKVEAFRCCGAISQKKIHITGNPVRKEILECAGNQKIYLGRAKPFTVLILGGSQGAHSINMAVIEALKFIKKKDKFFFLHQTGAADEEKIKNAYMSHGISCTIKAFFDDMAKQYGKADLIICRAGATTVAEVSAIGKGILFVPYPFAADNHQVLNALSLKNAGAAEMILQKDLSGKVLAEKIRHYASSPDALETMSSKIKELGRPDAAKAIVDDCYMLNPEPLKRRTSNIERPTSNDE